MTYNYDANGNLTGVSDGRSLTYNAADQTTAITPAGGDPLDMAYHDATQVDRAQAGETNFANTIQGVTRATDSTGAQRYTRDPQGNLVGLNAADGSDYYYLFDGLGSAVALTDAAGNVVNRYAYTPYGELTQTDETVSNPWRFTGEYHDAATGLYKIGHRYYDPNLARWTQPDPLGPRTNPMQPGEANPYAYAGCDPVNHTDPTGTSHCEIIRWAGLIAGLTLTAAMLLSPTLLGSVIVGAVGTVFTGISILAAIQSGCWGTELRH